MRARRQRLHDKVCYGAHMPWTCVLIGHRYGHFHGDGWKRCRRRGCSATMQWTKDPTHV